MGRFLRSEQIDESTVGVYLVTSRTISECGLLEDLSHRGYRRRFPKRELERRLERLAGIFAIDVLDYSIEEQFVHLMLRNRPDLVTQWPDEEVARRRLQYKRSNLNLGPKPSFDQIMRFCADREKVAQTRRKLSSMSEFLAGMKQAVAVAVNSQLDRVGMFWIARFRVTGLSNTAALLACHLYMGLNPILAGRAARIEESKFTSAFARLQDELTGGGERLLSGWLTPVHLDGDGYSGVAVDRRASDHGFLNMTFPWTLQFLDVIAEYERRSKQYPRAAERPQYPPLLAGLGISMDQWEAAIRQMSDLFNREVSIMKRFSPQAVC